MTRSTMIVRRDGKLLSRGSLIAGLVFTLSGAFGCKKSESDAKPKTETPVGVGSAQPTANVASHAPAIDNAGPAAQAAPLGTAVSASLPAAGAAPGPTPTSFADAPKVSVENAIGIGCEANAKDGWLQLFCYKRNSTGGRPVRAVFETPALAASARGEVPQAAEGSAQGASASGELNTAPAQEAADSPAGPSEEELAARSVTPKEDGELVLLLPWVEGNHTKARVEWSDVVFDLVVEGTNGRLLRPENLPLRRACAKLSHELEELRTSGKQSKNGLTPADVKKLSGFGQCQVSGAGAWALRLRALTPSGEGADRKLSADIEVLRLSAEGNLTSTPYGMVSFAPEGLEMPLPMIFDYDGDGTHEAIVRYDINKRASSDGAPLVPWASIFTMKDGKIVTYGPTPPAGSLSVEQLDNDLRPDVAGYGPFLGWLAKGCGVSNCPDRVTGPRFFWRALPDGTFDQKDPVALAALQRACSQKPTGVVAVQGASANLKTTAMHVACARVWQVDSKTITDELTAQREKLCGGAEPCAAFDLLTQWANAAPPATLGK